MTARRGEPNGFCFLKVIIPGGYGLGTTHPANDLRRKVLFDRLVAGPGSTFADIFKQHTNQDLTEDFNSSLLVPTPDKNQIFMDLNAHYANREIAAVLSELHDFIPTDLRPNCHPVGSRVL
jgi:hypothetical protein